LCHWRILQARKDLSVSQFKKDPLTDRLKDAANARKGAVDRFRSRPAADDPEVVAKQAARQAVSQAREARIAERDALRRVSEAERAREAVAEQARAADEMARQASETIAREAADNAERKIVRDARYAARKAKAQK
jgi:hypothetical protein